MRTKTVYQPNNDKSHQKRMEAKEFELRKIIYSSKSAMVGLLKNTKNGEMDAAEMNKLIDTSFPETFEKKVGRKNNKKVVKGKYVISLVASKKSNFETKISRVYDN